jgi:hypothetical protein
VAATEPEIGVMTYPPSPPEAPKKESAALHHYAGLDQVRMDPAAAYMQCWGYRGGEAGPSAFRRIRP